MATFVAVPAQAVQQAKVSLCHHTESESNPWVAQEVNANEVQSHLDNGDFLITEGTSCPPANSPTPSPSLSPSPTPCVLWDQEFPAPCPTPIPSVDPSPTPISTETPSSGLSEARGSSGAPDCQDIVPTKSLANFHLYRGEDQGVSQAIVKWLPDTNPEGNKVQLLYGVNGYGIQNSLVTENDGYVVVNLYDSQDYTFWGQVINGCAAGPVTNAVVDGSSTNYVLFR